MPFSLTSLILFVIYMMWMSIPTRALSLSAAAAAASNNQSCPRPSQPQQQVHLIVLVHGWMGNPQEMGYLKQSLERQAAAATSKGHTVVVHSAECNRGQTSDGIVAGGTRLANEVNQLIQKYAPPKNHSANATTTAATTTSHSLSLSFVGNSLGGLYARQALSQLRYNVGDSNHIRLAVFCTTATPHLGVSQHTYVPLFRMAEFVVAHVMQPTGRDLFRYTSAVQDLATLPQFVTPLRRFERRIAHANAHQTDFQVPTATAAFVSPESDSEHHIVPIDNDDVSSLPFWKLSVDTHPQSSDSNYNSDNQNQQHEQLGVINSTQMAERLDAMGWRKVFWDVRSILPSIPMLPSPWMFFATNHENDSNNSNNNNKSVYTSRELYRQFTTTDRILFPMGHAMMVANSKSDLFARINAGGRPVMDWVAKDLLRHIIGSVNPSHEEQQQPQP